MSFRTTTTTTHTSPFQQTPSTDKTKPVDVLTDMVLKIFSFAEVDEKKKVLLLCKDLRAKALNQAISKKVGELTSFIDLFKKKIDNEKFSAEITNLKATLQASNFISNTFKRNTLQAIDEAMLPCMSTLNKPLIDALFALKKEDLKAIIDLFKTEHVPAEFLETEIQMCILDKLYEKLDLALKNPDPDKLLNPVIAVCAELLRSGFYHQAKEIVEDHTPYNTNRLENALKQHDETYVTIYISCIKKLLAYDHLETALELIATLQTDILKDSCYLAIGKHCLSMNSIEMAEKISPLMTNHTKLAALIKKHHPKELNPNAIPQLKRNWYLLYVNELPYQWNDNYVYTELSQQLCKIFQLLKLLPNSIPPNKAIPSSFYDLACDYVETKNVAELVKFILKLNCAVVDMLRSEQNA